MISLRYSEIPSYLQESEFYVALNPSDPNDSFEVPSHCFRENEGNITTIDSLKHMINVIKFWGLTRTPQGVLEFCFDQDCSSWASTMDDLIFKDFLINLFEKTTSFTLNKALMTGKAEVVEFWLSKTTEFCKENNGSLAQACKFGRLDLVQLLRSRRFDFDQNACYAAAQYGHLHILEYFHSTGCPLDSDVPRYAARGGQLKCLKYLHEIGCPWDEDLTNEIPGPVFFHHMGALFNELPWVDDFSLITSTADDYFECLRYALENGCPVHKKACAMVCLCGLFEHLLLLRQYGAPWDAETFNGAVSGDHVHCVSYLYENGCSWDHSATTAAASTGNLDMLRFLLENDCPWNKELVPAAVARNNLSCLQYALQFGCPCDLATSRLIARKHSVDWLRCLFDYACPYDINIVETAARAKTVDCLRYLIEEQGLYMNENGAVLEVAFCYGQHDSIEFLLDYYCPVPEKLFNSVVVDDNMLEDALMTRIAFATEKKLCMSEKFLSDVVVRSNHYPLVSAYIRLHHID